MLKAGGSLANPLWQWWLTDTWEMLEDSSYLLHGLRRESPLSAGTQQHVHVCMHAHMCAVECAISWSSSTPYETRPSTDSFSM